MNTENNTFSDPSFKREAEIIKRIQESENIYTWHLRFVNTDSRKQYCFAPGQFNMLYLFGVGQVPISLLADIESGVFSHTIQAVGRVTKAMADLKVGDRVGVSGPFGKGWPLEEAKGKDVIVLSGGLGCAPTISAINHILRHRSEYKNLRIMVGFKYKEDYIFHDRYVEFQKAPNTELMLSASREKSEKWPYLRGRITEHIAGLSLNGENTLVIMCGPEGLMHGAAALFIDKAVPEKNIYISLERNMHCGVGHCGHCQLGGVFVCKNGPVFSYDKVKDLLLIRGL